MYSFGYFPGVRLLYADVSEHYLFHLHRLDVKYKVWVVTRGRGVYTGDEVYSRWRDQ